MGVISVLVWLDSISGDYFFKLYDMGELSNLHEFFDEGALVENAVATFPTVSESAEGSIITGLFSGEVNILGERYFSRSLARVMHYKFNARIEEDFPDSLKGYTIDRLSGGSLGIGRLIPVNAEIVHDPIAEEYERKGSLKLVERRVYTAVNLLKEKKPRLLLFTVSADYASHVSGREGHMVKSILKTFDELFPEIIKALRNVSDEFSVFVFSDHGSKEVSKHLDLTQLLIEYGFNPSDPGLLNTQKGCSSAALSNGRRMGMIYLKHPEAGWAKLEARVLRNYPFGGSRLDVSELLSQEEGIGLLAYRESENRVIVRSRDGEGVIEHDGERYRYLIVRGNDPLNYEPQLYGKWMNEEEWLKTTYNEKFPDAIVQLFSIFKAANCGDIILNPSDGWDFWEPWDIHYPKLVASHGGLSREEMRVFILARGPGIKRKRIPYSRLLDMYATLSAYYTNKTLKTHAVERLFS